MLEDGFARYSYLMEPGSYLPPYPEEKEPPTIWFRDVKVRCGFTATPKAGTFSLTQTAIHISLRGCFCSYRICSRIFRCRRPQMQIWSLYRSWDWKMSSRIPGKRTSTPRLQCLQMRQKRIAQHSNYQHHKNVPLPHSLVEGRFYMRTVQRDEASVQSRT